jgi:hypothetical protein
MQNTNSKD